MKKGIVAVLIVLGLGAPAAASGQTAWDSPLLLPPRATDGLGIYLTDMHRGGVSVMGTWRSPVWNYGLRLGLGDSGPEDRLAVFGGIDYSGVINTATSDFPVDVDWVAGVGAGISNHLRISVPVGLTAGYGFQAEGARFTPYITPRVVLDALFGSEEGPLDLDVAADFGLDLRFTGMGGPLSGKTVRFAATVGDRTAIGLGLAF